jgi:Domain of unknown function (DUF6321)
MKTRKPVWKRARPAKTKHSQLSPAKKSAAKQRAKRAGRPYPNLVDNIRAARKKTVRKKSARKSPEGGLTAKGREWYRRKQGAHLKPGVKAKKRDMSPQEMRRKGSWAVRFYGRAGELPPLRSANGNPTRFALTAAAWGEPVPKTAAAARKIAAKGRRLLAAYHRTKA